MEDAFNQLKGKKMNTVDNLIQWMRDTGAMKQETSEEEAQRLFSGVADTADVELAAFSRALETLADQQNTPVADLVGKLGAQVPKMMDAVGSALSSGVNAAKDAFNSATQ